MDLSKKIVMLLQDQQLRETLGQSLQMRIQKEFSLEKMCSRTAELISLSLKQAR
jgi:glycosyltransferase involved in cell wall biosynthesis